MLRTLDIKKYALIDSLEIDFESGFSVITGETGAGKSIILGALGLILGQRADVKAIKQGENKCVIEGTFDVSTYDLKSFCEEKGIEYDSESYILRREILSSGKSRAFINDTPVSLTDLKDLGSQLIDIHSQHQNLLLADDHFQMQVLDTLAGNRELVKEYHQQYKLYKQAEKALHELKEKVRKSKEEEDYIRFQYEALREASLVEGEQESLENEQESLSHAEDIKLALYKVNNLLSCDDIGVVSRLKESLNTTQSLIKVYPPAQSIAQRLEEAYIDLQDLSTETERLMEDVEFNPERLSEIEIRLNLLYSLQKKHRLTTVDALLGLYVELEQQIGNIDSSDEQVSVLEQALATAKTATERLASVLSTQRQAEAKAIEMALIAKIATLGMPNIRFECHLSAKEKLDTTGGDDLEFLFSANKNGTLQPVSTIASGGEISRLMLCLKSMIAGATALPTIIFDEIDTGVSGEIADKMGLIMAEFGQQMQVLAISHLPQIAARGKAQYKVYKTDSSDTTTTHLVRLSDTERLEEIARMLSGATVTDAAIRNAKEMLGYKE